MVPPVDTGPQTRRFKPTHRVAQSYLGELWSAERQTAQGEGTKVLLRRIRLPEGAPEEAHEAFLRCEASARALSHPHVLTALAVRDTPGELRVIYDHFDALCLQSLLASARAQGKRFPIEVALRITSDLLQGLSCLQEAHDTQLEIAPFGGVSPASVLVSPDNGETKLCDALFSSCAALLEDLGRHPDKLAYVAPEQVHPVDQPTPQCDLFAVGVILWELVAGRKLLAGTRATIERKLLEHDFPDLAVSVGDVRGPSPKLAALVRACLAADPLQRPESAAELLQRIAQCGHPIAEREVVAGFVASIAEANTKPSDENPKQQEAKPSKRKATAKPSNQSPTQPKARASDGNPKKARDSQNDQASKKAIPQRPSAGRVPMPSLGGKRPLDAAQRSTDGKPGTSGRPRMKTVAMGSALSDRRLPPRASAQATGTPETATTAQAGAPPPTRRQLEETAERVSKAETKPPPSAEESKPVSAAPAPFFPPPAPMEPFLPSERAAAPPRQASPPEAKKNPSLKVGIGLDATVLADAAPPPAQQTPTATATPARIAPVVEPPPPAELLASNEPLPPTEPLASNEPLPPAESLASNEPLPPAESLASNEPPPPHEPFASRYDPRQADPASLANPGPSPNAISPPPESELPSHRHAFSLAPEMAPPIVAPHYPRKLVLGLGGLAIVAIAGFGLRAFLAQPIDSASSPMAELSAPSHEAPDEATGSADAAEPLPAAPAIAALAEDGSAAAPPSEEEAGEASGDSKSPPEEDQATTEVAAAAAPAPNPTQAAAADLGEGFAQSHLDDALLARAFSMERRTSVEPCPAAAGNATSASESAAHLQSARRALVRGETEAARRDLCTAVARDGSNADARRALAELLLNLGDPARAQEIAQAGLDQNPNDAELWGQLADALAVQGDVAASRDALLRADGRRGSAAARAKTLASAYGKAGLDAYNNRSYTRARSFFRRALVLGHGGLYHGMRLAEALLWLEEANAALAWAERAANAMTRSWRAQMVLGDAYEKIGNAEAARGAWRRAEELHPRSTLVQRRLGKL